MSDNPHVCGRAAIGWIRQARIDREPLFFESSGPDWTPSGRVDDT